MSICCCPTHITTKTEQSCPECGSVCKAVGMPTLYHQVRFPENQTLNIENYFFCPSQNCSVGYFSGPVDIIPKLWLRSYQDLQNDEVCFCFNITSQQYVSALKTQKAEPIKNFILQRTKAKECACEIKNPSGQCCLSKFKVLEKLHRSDAD